jgi:tripartite ATP-independent transporter DctM subunit
VARVEIAALFKAALVPGILLVAGLSVYVICHERFAGSSRRKVQPEASDVSWRRVHDTFMEGKWEWPVGVIILAGVYGGIVTITEVSALVVAYVLLVECVILKEIHPVRQLPDIIVESAMLSGAVLVILGMSLGLTGFLVDQQVPGKVLELLSGLTDSKILFLAGLNLFLLVVGCIMDIFSAMIIVAPIMVPVAAAYGVDPLHLGVIFLVNLEIGYSTPPIGMNLFIASLKFGRPVTVLYRASLPYLAVLLLLLALITYVPIISLWSAG